MLNHDNVNKDAGSLPLLRECGVTHTVNVASVANPFPDAQGHRKLVYKCSYSTIISQTSTTVIDDAGFQLTLGRAWKLVHKMLPFQTYTIDGQKKKD